MNDRDLLETISCGKLRHDGHSKEEIPVDFNHVFARYRFDVCHNTERKIKLTPEHNLPLYTRGPPTQLGDEFMIELAPMQIYCTVTTIPQSKYTSPLCAYRKRMGETQSQIYDKLITCPQICKLFDPW